MKKRFFRKILSSFVLAFSAGDPLVLDNIGLERVVDRVEIYLAQMPPVYSWGLRCLILLVEYGVPPLTTKFRPLHRLPVSERVAYLDEWGTSRFFLKRIGYTGLKFIFLPPIYSEEELLFKLGYSRTLEERMVNAC